jgi:transcriptional regulator with XRE-family HTH domain
MPQEVKNVGELIRQGRKNKKITLVELSKLTGVAQATLSRIETGVMQGTVESHRKIAEALGLGLAELYSGVDERLSAIAHQAQSKREPASFLSEKVKVEVLTPSAMQKKIFPALITFSAKSETQSEKTERGIDKFVYCISGKVTVDINHHRHELQEGDSLYFDASLAHRYLNGYEKEAKLFVITSPPRI